MSLEYILREHYLLWLRVLGVYTERALFMVAGCPWSIY